MRNPLRVYTHHKLKAVNIINAKYHIGVSQLCDKKHSPQVDEQKYLLINRPIYKPNTV